MKNRTDDIAKDIWVFFEKPFVLELFSKMRDLSEKNSQEIENQIRLKGEYSERTQYNTLFEYLAVQGNYYFQPKEDKFSIKVLQDVYKNDKEQIIKVWIKWANCGGFGGLVLNGKYKGKEGGNMHDHFPNIIIEGKSYEYNYPYYGRFYDYPNEEQIEETNPNTGQIEETNKVNPPTWKERILGYFKSFK